MLDQHLYVQEKLEDRERSRLTERALLVAAGRSSPRHFRSRRSLVAPFVRVSGKALMAVGRTLESWSAPATTENDRAIQPRSSKHWI